MNLRKKKSDAVRSVPRWQTIRPLVCCLVRLFLLSDFLLHVHSRPPVATLPAAAVRLAPGLPPSACPTPAARSWPPGKPFRCPAGSGLQKWHPPVGIRCHRGLRSESGRWGCTLQGSFSTFLPFPQSSLRPACPSAPLPACFRCALPGAFSSPTGVPLLPLLLKRYLVASPASLCSFSQLAALSQHS